MTRTDEFDEAVPSVAKRLGFLEMRGETGRIVLSGSVDPAHDGDPSLIHSLAAATIDAALDRAFRSVLVAGDAPTVVELKVRFARPFTSGNGVMTCLAHVVELGEHIGTAQAQITDASANVFVEADATCVIRRGG